MTSEAEPDRGMPKAGRALDRIMKAAERLFYEQGLASTTMEAIAREADVSKVTLYSYFRNRDELFASIVKTTGDTYSATLLVGEDGTESFEAKLMRFGRTVLDLLLAPDVVSSCRAVIAEAARFPGLGGVYYDNGPNRLLKRLEDVFAAAMAAGLMRNAPPRHAAMHFIGLVRGDLQLCAMLGMERARSDAERSAIVASGVEAFRRAYRPDPDVAAPSAPTTGRGASRRSGSNGGQAPSGT
jgi:TetR/AcrR family transcriptional regulator, mexJK operon transcriptional repressor